MGNRTTGPTAPRSKDASGHRVPDNVRRIRVAVVDDHAVVREGLRGLLRAASDLVVAGEATDGEGALRLAETVAPHVLVLDVVLPDFSGIEVARWLRATHPEIRVLYFTAHDEDCWIQDAIASGAAGYLLKRDGPLELIEAVRGVARGETGWFSRQIISKALQHGSLDRLTTEGGSEQLSPREREVLILLARGLENDEIGAALTISEATVKNHVTAIYAKLPVRTRTGACAWAWEHGLVGAPRSESH